jgi:hypothetical protein
MQSDKVSSTMAMINFFIVAFLSIILLNHYGTNTSSLHTFILHMFGLMLILTIYYYSLLNPDNYIKYPIALTAAEISAVSGAAAATAIAGGNASAVATAASGAAAAVTTSTGSGDGENVIDEIVTTVKKVKKPKIKFQFPGTGQESAIDNATGSMRSVFITFLFVIICYNSGAFRLRNMNPINLIK